jgi:hypothetical protein
MATTLSRCRPRWPLRAERFPGRRLVLAFQPHRYTRTRDCFGDFVNVMGLADAVLLAEVYPAGEAPSWRLTAKALARALRAAGKVEPVFVADISAMPHAIVGTAHAQATWCCAWGRARSGACLPKWLNCYKIMSTGVQEGARAMSQFGKVAVLMGGASAEREVSLMSGSGVLNALACQGCGCACI